MSDRSLKEMRERIIGILRENGPTWLGGLSLNLRDRNLPSGSVDAAIASLRADGTITHLGKEVAHLVLHEHFCENCRGTGSTYVPAQPLKRKRGDYPKCHKLGPEGAICRRKSEHDDLCSNGKIRWV